MILDERQAWLLFIGLLGASLGVTLFCDAAEYAGAVTGWGTGDREDDAPRLARYYRAAGAAFGAAGAALSAAALAAPDRVGGRFKPFATTDQGRIAGGMVFVLAGSVLAAARMIARPRPLSGELAGSAGPDRPFRRRLAAAARWARVGLVTLYGCFLLSRIGGLPQ